MDYQSMRVEEPVNLSFKTILHKALSRFRAMIPCDIELAIDVTHDSPRIRAHELHLEDALLSACMVAWESIGGISKQIVVEIKEVLLDDMVLDEDAEKLGGGLPPRNYVWLLISNDTRMQAGPFHTILPLPKKFDDRHSNFHRLKLLEIREVIELHNGWMTVDTLQDKGISFEFYLPCAVPLEAPTLNESGSSVKRIMYVDDYLAMRVLIGEMLPDAGFQVSCFESANEALGGFSKNPSGYDALVSDYRLHGPSGLDLMRQIKYLQPELPVIILSGYVDEALKRKAMEQGAAAVLSKTSDVMELCARLRALLETVPNPASATYSEWARL